MGEIRLDSDRAHPKSYMFWAPVQRQQFERNLDETHVLILESLQEREEATEAHLGNTDAGGSHLWEHDLPWGPWCWQVWFWSPSPSLLPPGAYLQTNGPVATTQGKTCQPSRTRPALPTNMPRIVNPTTKERTTQPHTVGAPGARNFNYQRGVCSWEQVSPLWPLLQDQETERTYPIYRNQFIK